MYEGWAALDTQAPRTLGWRSERANSLAAWEA